MASGKKRDSAHISGVNDTRTDGGQVGGTTAGSGGQTSGKNACGKSGVEFRFYKHKVFHVLTKKQKEELTEWRNKSQEYPANRGFCWKYPSFLLSPSPVVVE
eukprot:10578146-Ditylum_brightwellii.AAC.1